MKEHDWGPDGQKIPLTAVDGVSVEAYVQTWRCSKCKCGVQSYREVHEAAEMRPISANLRYKTCEDWAVASVHSL